MNKSISELDGFTSPITNSRSEFNPSIIDLLIDKHAAGISNRPKADQIRDWMNARSEVPEEYHEAIRSTIIKLDGYQLILFRRNCGSSVNGLAHLALSTGVDSYRFTCYMSGFKGSI